MATPLLVAEINSITHGQYCQFVKWPPETSKWLTNSTDTYDKMMHYVSGKTFSKVYAPQHLDIESNVKALHLLVSEIDVFGNGRHLKKMASKIADTMASFISQYLF